MAHTAVLVGTGGRGAAWCGSLLPPHVADGRLEVVAAVDVDESALATARDPDGLGLSPDRCYRDAETALEAHEPDACFVAVPSSVHEDVVATAAAHGADVLVEKPISDTMAGTARIAERVDRTGVRLGVMMNHRFDRDKESFRRALHAGDCGPLDYLVYRFTCDCREYGDWGAEWKYAMDEPLLVGGAVHHLDVLAAFADAPPERVTAETWNPPWSEFAGNAQALVTVRFANGVRATYEGAKANASGRNGWGNDYVRAECRDATLVLDARELTRVDREQGAGPVMDGPRPDAGRRIPLADGERWAGVRVVGQFLDWLDGGEPMPSQLESSLRSAALLFGAAESGRTGSPVDVPAFLERAPNAPAPTSTTRPIGPVSTRSSSPTSTPSFRTESERRRGRSGYYGRR